MIQSVEHNIISADISNHNYGAPLIVARWLSILLTKFLKILSEALDETSVVMNPIYIGKRASILIYNAGRSDVSSRICCCAEKS